MANQWLRLWHDMPTDPKWRTIAKASGQRIGDVMAVYLHLLVCASNADERGRTQSFNSEDVASALDLETEQVESIVAAMQARVLDGDKVRGWEKRQVAREDGAAERAKAWREAQKAKKAADLNATERDRTQTERNQTPDTDTDTEKEPSGSLCVAPAAVASDTTRGSRLPDGWVLPKDWGEWALDEFPHWTAPVVRTIAAQFADHWHAQPGKAGRKSDWPATWRNWCRSDITQRAHAPPRIASKQTALEARNRAVIDEFLEAT